MRVIVRSFGEKQINREILGIRERALDMRPVFKVVLKMIYQFQKELFDSEGASGGEGKWAPLAESTVKKKANRRVPPGQGDPRILHDTRVMRLSLTAPNQLGSRWSLQKGMITFGTDIPYAQFHYEGTSRMPERRPVSFNEEQRVLVVKEIEHYIMGGFGRF